MYHHDIMRSIMQERAGERRAEARAARNAALARRAREFWDERSQRLARPVRRPSGRRGAAPAG
ncbi:hypothetical protein [Actinomadura verrucosospora]|uniref:Uncharacterized protein n=1 Tax=Actinomadura verrucosospora TaxID=46165 RepID=A0A7D3ZP44_ACTVE|nr:hypothetical protein [Actinomadura verrucosospora]QKG25421.1 hypothetical protein ACTIVE_7073 [Actinomadura verrucosospora]